VENAADDRTNRYRRAVNGIIRFRGRRPMDWSDPARMRWTHGGLTVTCNPDLGIIDRGSRYLLRLHYDAAPPTRALVSAHAELMRLARGNLQDVQCGLLDVDRSRIRTSSHSGHWEEALQQEADNFMNYWNRRPRPRQQTA